jgi:hypothetical protein
MMSLQTAGNFAPGTPIKVESPECMFLGETCLQEGNGSVFLVNVLVDQVLTGLTGQVPATRTVLIVDNDLGFVCWLGDLFNEIGSRPLPALSCEHAAALMKRLGIEPDLIVFNPRLPGVDGMLQNLIRQDPHIELVSIGPPSEALAVPIHASATVERPSAGEPISRVEWLEKVRRLLKGSDANSCQGRGWQAFAR